MTEGIQLAIGGSALDSQLLSISSLIADLDSPDTNVANEAQYSLQARGIAALPPVLEALPRLGIFGQRCALDLIQSLPINEVSQVRDPSVADVLIPLLASHDCVVLAWSADTLGWIGAREAIPALQRALERLKEAGVSVIYSERLSLLHALSALGARNRVLPLQAKILARNEEVLGECWSAQDLPLIIESLAAENQVILYFQIWIRSTGALYWQEASQYEADLSGPWNEIVERNRIMALGAAQACDLPKDAVVNIEWIAESDR